MGFRHERVACRNPTTELYMRPTFTQQYLHNILHYEPETGHFYWKWAKSKRVKAGERAGAMQGLGYWQIMIDGHHYYASALAWYYVHGEWLDRVDHADRDESNDRIDNLRPCTRAQNRHNAKVNSNNYAGIKGVRFRIDCEKWQARIHVDGKSISLGHFLTKEEATAAYAEAAKKYYGEYASTGN